MSTNLMVDKQQGICTMKYCVYSLKIGEFQLHTATSMNLKIMLAGRCKSQKNPYSFIPFIRSSQTSKIVNVDPILWEPQTSNTYKEIINKIHDSRSGGREVEEYNKGSIPGGSQGVSVFVHQNDQYPCALSLNCKYTLQYTHILK